MNVKVIGGIHGGRKLDAPAGRTTHPMGERIRNALFNSLAERVVDATILDVFAGTGAVGIEALSRGAASVVFVEKDKIAQKCIANNIASLNLTHAQLIKAPASSWLDTYQGDKFDIIIADPPYHDTQVGVLHKLIPLLVPNGIFVLSWPEKQEPPVFEGMTVLFDRVYAGARIVMYQNV